MGSGGDGVQPRLPKSFNNFSCRAAAATEPLPLPTVTTPLLRLKLQTYCYIESASRVTEGGH